MYRVMNLTNRIYVFNEQKIIKTIEILNKVSVFNKELVQDNQQPQPVV